MARRFHKKLYLIPRKEKKSPKIHYSFIKIVLNLIFLVGASLVVYSSFKGDLNTTLLGIGITFLSLVTDIIITRLSKKPIKSKKHVPKHKKKRVKWKKFNFRKILFTFFHLSRRHRKVQKKIKRKSNNIKMVLFTFFLLFSVVGMVYFYFVKIEYLNLGINAAIFLLSIIGLISIKKKSRVIGVVKIKEDKKKVKEEKVELKVKKDFLKTDEIKFRRIVKEKIKNLGTDKTPIDVLHWLIQEKKEIKFHVIGKIFNINIKKVEGWAKILETHGLAEINYPAFGEPRLKSKGINEVKK